MTLITDHRYRPGPLCTITVERFDTEMREPFHSSCNQPESAHRRKWLRRVWCPQCLRKVAAPIVDHAVRVHGFDITPEVPEPTTRVVTIPCGTDEAPHWHARTEHREGDLWITRLNAPTVTGDTPDAARAALRGTPEDA
jgi:hypothetical protein